MLDVFFCLARVKAEVLLSITEVEVNLEAQRVVVGELRRR